MTHGVRPHMARGKCRIKLAFTTREAAAKMAARVKDAERPYQADCCGYWHITRLTKDEFAQRVAQNGVQDAAVRGMLDLTDAEYLEYMDQLEAEREAEEAARLAALAASQPRGGEGGSGTEAFRSGGTSRLAPSPAAVARRLQGRGNPGR